MQKLKSIISSIPIVGSIVKSLKKKPTFTSSGEYWEQRYKKGGNSGIGSYDELAIFKAEVINEFVTKNEPKTVIEFGSGDGNQLQYLNFNSYTGFDVSHEAIKRCRKTYNADASKSFEHIQNYNSQKADLVMSLDVIFHLVEDEVYLEYMSRLFKASNKFVIIYSSNEEWQDEQFAKHVRHRKFTSWIEQNAPHFKLIQHIPNKYPKKENNKVFSYADFYIFQAS